MGTTGESEADGNIRVACAVSCYGHGSFSMRMWNVVMVILGVVAGLVAALIVVATHEVRIPPAIAAGLVAPPKGVDYSIPTRPSDLAGMEAALAGEQATHFEWWTFYGEMLHATGDEPRAAEAWERAAALAIEAAGDRRLGANQWRPAYRAGWCLWRLGRVAEAGAWMDRALLNLEVRADDGTRGARTWDLLFVGFARRVLGDEPGAVQAWTEMMKRHADGMRRDEPSGRGGGSYYYNLARLLAMMGDRAAALSAFEASARHRRFVARDAWWTPSFQSIRDDPRFRAVLDGNAPEGELWPAIGPELTGDPRPRLLGG
ncbi:MAG: tetratricopeptide repeat protein [Planctomycetes bacterium]|nr:tetratricopeptide repeat protein [Planctomycetota bacterium]